MEKTVVQRMGEFVHGLAYETLPKEIIDKAKACMVNGIGIGIACHGYEYARIGREVVKAEEVGIAKEKSATIFCDGSKVSVMGAAFANAALFHGRAQEDTLGTSHTGTIITPAALALAERNGNSGKEVMTAVVAGYEVVGALDRELSAIAIPRGFRASPLFGIFGSAAAASKLLHLSEEQTVNALGFAAGFAGGTMECFAAGTMEWRFQVGVTSREGITSALLAKYGGKAAPTAMEGPAGYLRAFVNTADMAGNIVAQLGEKWEILNAGFKPHPVCAFNQTPVLAMLALVKENTIQPADIERIRLWVSTYVYNYVALDSRGPFSTIDGTLMSTPFCLALAGVEKEVTMKGLNRFTYPEVLALINRVERIEDKTLTPYSCILEVQMKGGKKFRKEMIITPAFYNFSMDQTIALVKQVTSETGVDPSKVDRMIKLVRELPKAADVRPLVDVLAGCP